MPIEHKEILDAVAEGTKTLKADFEKARKEQGEAFDKKVEQILEDLKLKSSLEDVTTKVKEVKEDLEKGSQKNFDEFAAKYAKQGAGPKVKSFRAAISEAIKENQEKLKSLGGSDSHVMQMKDMGFEDFNGYGIFTRDVKNEVIDVKEEAFHMRQILGSGSTQGDTVYYPKAVGKTGTGPAPWDYDHTTVGDTPVKPDFEFEFTNMSAPVKWIAGILRIPKQMLDDLAWLQSYISTHAPLELLKAEDNQILNGNGIGNSLDGILNNAAAYSNSGGYLIGIERIIDAAFGQMAVANQDSPTNVLLNPINVVSIILNKAAVTGTYNLPNGVVGVVNGKLQIAGLEVNKTNKINAGTFLVGDFRRGASLVTRQAPQLRAFEQDRDNVQKNMITFRIEERVALPIFYDDAFVTGALANS